MSDPLVGNVSGIYQIRNLTNEKVYVGSTNCLRRRRSEHFRWLRKGAHPNPILQRAWVKQGEASFAFEVLEVCAPEVRMVREQHYLDTYRHDYNIHLDVTAVRILGASDACREAVRKHATGNKYRLGMKHSVATIELLRQRRAGQVISPETRQKMSKTRQGHSVTQKVVDTITQLNRERVWTDEARGKASEIHKALMTPAAREVLAHANRGKTATPETRAKMSTSRTGKTASEETKQRMADSRRAYWAQKRLEKEGPSPFCMGDRPL
jgi:group I intron endonuclease